MYIDLIKTSKLTNQYKQVSSLWSIFENKVRRDFLFEEMYKIDKEKFLPFLLPEFFYNLHNQQN